ncbi:hypothetical protein ACIRSS_47585 [Amycolatopsis sp. NPDC101161]|uniref:hypothetical protein n=1 Tax=Amycolatopsis sp. NPDC101161 TaxID=3363940 RepID=UPI003821A66A
MSRNMYRSYESHVPLYLRSHLGALRRDRLRVEHLDVMFEAIVERNELIGEYRASGDPRKVAAVKWQRPVGPTSLHRIKETLREVLRPFVAKLVELPFAGAAEAEVVDSGAGREVAVDRGGSFPGHGVDGGADRAVPGLDLRGSFRWTRTPCWC